MPWAQKRVTDKGKERWRGFYRDVRGNVQSAGTHSTEAKAVDAARREEIKASLGRVGDPRRGKQKFRNYVTETWLPHHVMEASTRQGYTYQIEKHILPWFDGMNMNAILPSDVREWVTHLTESGVSPRPSRTCGTR